MEWWRKAGRRLNQAAGLLMMAGVCVSAICLGQQKEYVRTYRAEEAASEIDWESLVKEWGYEPRTGDEPSYTSAEQAKSLSLYARGAVLMDADSGRILYGREEDTEFPMASTTKIMTCIVALENANPEDEVVVSSYAASQPEVRLGLRAGESYILEDLLYAMMLTSYNDCAVAIAEHVAGSVEDFAAMMNQKAKDIGCYSTWYITPNGLDSENEGGVHRTTAAELARVLSYAIRNESFLTITRTASHSFQDCSGKRSFTAVNKNAFLSMMDGALSGKTGYTSAAGYCYAGALSRDGKTLVVALLGSGWPPNKTWKWADTRTLMNYGLENYEMVTVGAQDLITEAMIPVFDGVKNAASVSLTWNQRTLLAQKGEIITAKIHVPETIQAPLPRGAVIGYIQVYLSDDPVLLIPVVLTEEVEAFSLRYCVEHIFAGFFDISFKV